MHESLELDGCQLPKPQLPTMVSVAWAQSMLPCHILHAVQARIVLNCMLCMHCICVALPHAIALHRYITLNDAQAIAEVTQIMIRCLGMTLLKEQQY